MNHTFVPVPEVRVAAFEEMGFGMFVHYGLYSQTGQGEWMMKLHNIPASEYGKLKDSFTAEKFDGRRLAKIAKNAGMKYITLTARHHDGFSLYDTCGLCDYDAPHSPAGRDLVRDFVEGCREEGILPILYHTTIDWYQPLYRENFREYLEYLRESVEILCRNYGKIGGFWFDGNWDRPATDWDEDGLYATIRKYQPDALIINNTGLDARGNTGHPELDSVTFEQGRPTPMNRVGMKKYLAAEMCHTMNGHWGYGSGDFNYKSLPELIETLCACRKVGANDLLNVGPNGAGEIPSLQAALLEEIGSWIRTCGSCIYRGKPSEIVGEHKNFALEQDGDAYLFIHNLATRGNLHVTVPGGGNGEKVFRNVRKNVKSVEWTDNGEPLRFVQDGDVLRVDATGYRYGCNYVVRTARVRFES